MTLGITTIAELKEMVDDYMKFNEFVIDVETKGETEAMQLDPTRNEVFWISFATFGRADVVACGHPLGERIAFPPVDDEHRFKKNGKDFEERRVNPETGKMKWFPYPQEFTPPPQQLWLVEVIDIIKPLLFSDRRKIGHNVKFDMESLAKYFGAMPPGPFGDTMVAAKLVDENQMGYGLKDMVKREFNFEYDKIGKFVAKAPYSEAYQYSFYDSKYCWLLWRRLGPRLVKENLWELFELEMDLVPGIVDMELTGIAIDQKALSSLDNEFHFDLAKLQLELSEAAGFEINMNAGRQKAELIYDILEIPCPKCGKRVSKTPDLDLHPSGDGPDNCNIYTKSGERTTAANTLEEMDDPLIEKMLDYAKLAKLTQAFTTGITEKLNEGRIHADFDQSGARSGRFSCRNPNLQQIPSRSERGKRVRELFVASPGNVLIVSDLSQIELRMLAHYTQDKGLLSCYHQNLDLHAQTAAIAYGEKFTPIDRTYAKNVNFSIVYGAGARTITRKYHLPNQRVAEKLLAAFYDAYPRVQPWKEEIWDEACRRFRKGRVPPYVTTILGRKRRLPALLWGGTKEKNRLRSAAERQAISVTISGSAADLFKTIVIDANNVFEDFGWGHCLMLVHDEIVAEVPEKYAEDGLIVIKEVMENVRNPFTDEKFLSVPIVADTHLVTRWSDAK